VDVIATDHAAASAASKMQEFEKCHRIIGLETAIGITLEQWSTRHITVARMVELVLWTG